MRLHFWDVSYQIEFVPQLGHLIGTFSDAAGGGENFFSALDDCCRSISATMYVGVVHRNGEVWLDDIYYVNKWAKVKKGVPKTPFDVWRRQKAAGVKPVKAFV